MKFYYYIIIGFCIIFLLLVFLLIKYKKKIKNIYQEKESLKLEKQKYINHELEEIEEIFRERKEKLNEELDLRKKDLENIFYQYYETLKSQLNFTKASTQQAKEAINEQFETYRAAELQKINSQIELTREREENRLKKQLEDYTNTYNNLTKEYIAKCQEQTDAAQQEYSQILEVLEDFRARREVINQQIMREREANENTDFYRICLTEEEIEDLKIIKDIEHKFNNKEVLHRAAYDCYIKRPLQEMEKRVLGGEKFSGIYIITYIPTGEIYIGRSTDISNRWQEHCKSAYGVGTIAHSTLHTKMARDGIWNFTFQVLERVGKEKLSEREKYWIDLYGATNLLNQKQGG